jgi:hypothetical protein
MEPAARPLLPLAARRAVLVAAAVASCLGGLASARAQGVGVVSHVKVVSDKVEDVSSLDSWKRSVIRDDMTDAEKAVAIFETVLRFRHQDAPPNEFLQSEANVHDAIKTFNVYGYGMCCCASATIEQLARYLGLPARGFGINAHSVPEVYYDGAWHLLDASLLAYYPKEDGTLASLEELTSGVRPWLADHPDLRGNGEALTRFMYGRGWRNGPAILAACPFYDENGWLMAGTHGWSSTMQELDCEPFVYEYGYSQGYEVNIELRPGERLTRNWSNRGLHVNMMGDGDAPGCLGGAVGQGDLRYAAEHGDLANGRVGNGTLEYEPPLRSPAFAAAALAFDNLSVAPEGDSPALSVADAANPGDLTLDMPSSYVYLGGVLSVEAVVGAGGRLMVLLSDNNGLDWRPVAEMLASGEREVILTPLVFRRYDYRLKVLMHGAGTGLDRLRITHDIQQSQRALPALGEGTNTITFSADPGPAIGTVTIDAQTNPDTGPGKQPFYTDFHPELDGLGTQFMRVGDTGTGVATFPIETPGDMVRLRFGGHYRARDATDGWDMLVSFDDGATFETVGRSAGPTQGESRYFVVNEVPPGTRSALVRWSGQQRNTTCVFCLRIDADYELPGGGFAPVKVTYEWEENGQGKRDVHTARAPEETYEIVCGARPRMRSVVLEPAR